jgi:hypothetical protein
MLLRLIVLSGLGYAAYRYVKGSKEPPQIALAGGPLSDKATLQSDPNVPPINSPSQAEGEDDVSPPLKGSPSG